MIPAFKAKGDWCAEHGLPESQCAVCDPRLAPAPPKAPPMSPAARREAAPTVGCRKHAQRIQLASAAVVAQAGIATTPVLRAPFRDVLTTTAEVAFAADRHARLASRVTGTVVEVPARPGELVEQGAVLARVESPELGAAAAAWSSAADLLALWERNHARELELVARGLGTQRAVIDADTRRVEVRADVARAEQRLRDLGLTGEELAALRAGGGAPGLAVRAPFPGVVLTREAVPGEVVEAGRPLVSIADTRSMWALLAVPEAASARLAVGQQVVFTTRALPGERFAGTLDWISSQVDRRTRTVEARATLSNVDGRLRANLFGSAALTLVDRGDALLVPRDAVQWEGCCNVVFLPVGDAAFEARKVQLGGATETHVQVLTGLAGGEAVVSVGAFLLRTEILKGSIGAGCCEGE